MSVKDEHQDQFVSEDAPYGFVPACRTSPQALWEWCAGQPLVVLEQVRRILFVQHRALHDILREEISSRKAEADRAEVRLAMARAERVGWFQLYAGIGAIFVAVVGIVIAVVISW